MHVVGLCSITRASAVIATVVAVGLGSPSLAPAQALSDADQAKALAKCAIVIDRTSAKFAVKKLKTLAKCVGGILKCVETKPGVAKCLDQARERCDEQLPAAVGEQAKVTDAVVRKCGSDVDVAAFLDPAGLDWESRRDECADRFGIALDDLGGI